MTNREALERINQAHSARIEKLFWLAGASESSDLKDFLCGISTEDWERMLPDVRNSEFFNQYIENDEEVEMLFDHQKFGFIAEIHTPHCSGFTFKEGKPIGWRTHGGALTIDYVYAETLEDLIKKIEAVAEENFQADVQGGTAKLKS